MTGPLSNTIRHTVDTINSDGLDALYDRLENAEAEIQQYAEADSADAAAGSYAHRAERVEAQLESVRDLHRQWLKAGPPPLGVPTARWWDRRLAELHAAIDGPDGTHATAPPPAACPACRRADQAGLAASEQHPACVPEEQ